MINFVSRAYPYENFDVKKYQKLWQNFPDYGNFDVKITRTKHFDVKIYQIRQNSGKKGQKISFWPVTQILAEFWK